MWGRGRTGWKITGGREKPSFIWMGIEREWRTMKGWREATFEWQKIWSGVLKRREGFEWGEGQNGVDEFSSPCRNLACPNLAVLMKWCSFSVNLTNLCTFLVSDSPPHTCKTSSHMSVNVDAPPAAYWWNTKKCHQILSHCKTHLDSS